MSKFTQLPLPFCEKDNNSSLIISSSFNLLFKKILSDIKKYKQGNFLSPVYVIVPSRILGKYLKRNIDCGGINIISLKDFASLISEDILWKENKKLITPIEEEFLLKNSLKKDINSTNIFYPYINSTGFIKTFSSFYKDLRQSSIDKHVKIDLFNDANFPINIKKLSALLEIVKEYRKQLTKEHYDFVDLMEKASINSYLLNSKLKIKNLFIFGFHFLDYCQKKFIKGLKNNSDIKIYFPYLKGNILSESTYSFFKELNLNNEIILPIKLKSTNSLNRVKKHFLKKDIPKKPISQDNSIKILSLSTQEDEVRQIAREILKAAMEGVPFNEMAIVLNDPASYGFHFYDLFNEIGIPLYYHGGLPFTYTKIGKSLKIFLKILRGEFKRFDIIEFITLGNINYKNFFTDYTPSAEIWDIITRKAGIQQGYEQWQNRLKKLIKSYKTKLEALKDITEKERLLKSIIDIEMLIFFINKTKINIKAFPEISTLENYINLLKKMIRLFFRGNNDEIDSFMSNIETLKNLYFSKNEISINSFTDIVIKKIETGTLKIGEFIEGCVNLFSLPATLGLEFSHIFMPGLDADKFPCKKEENPLLYDEQRIFINKKLKGQGHIIEKKESQKQDPLLFYFLIQSCNKGLVLTFHRNSDNKTGETVPSPFLLDIGNTLMGKRLFYDNLSSIPHFKIISPRFYRLMESSNFLDRGEYIQNSLKFALKNNNDEILSDFAFHHKTFLNSINHWNNNNNKLFNPYNGKICGKMQIKWLEKKADTLLNPASISKLEQFHTCPYKFFLNRIINIEALESPESIKKISGKDRGNLFHKILHNFFNYLKQEELLPLTLDNKDKYYEILNDISISELQEVYNTGITGDFSSWYEQEISVRENLKNFLQREIDISTGSQKNIRANFTPNLFEHSFGMEDNKKTTMAKIEIDNSFTLRYQGRIDRIDISHDKKSCLIIDYKTGNLPSKKKGTLGILGGKRLQLPLYLYSISQIIDGILDIEKSIALYYCINKKNNFKEITFTGYELKNMETELKKIIKFVFNGVKEGFFIPYPGKIDNIENIEGEHCKYCDYKSICSREISKIYMNKESDPYIKPFKELKEIQ